MTKQYDSFDIVVIGSGPGGYVAALKAAQLGASVAVVEKQPFFGGTCLNFGCIPSKALLATAELLHTIEEAKHLGVSVDGKASFDWAAVQKRKDKVIAKLRGGVKGLFAARKVATFRGVGRLAGAGKVTVTGADGKIEELAAGKVILAVGSTPARIPGWPDDPTRVCTSDESLHWKDLPKKLILVGGGVIGCEFACMMQPLGVDVTLVEMMPRLLPEMDAELADAMAGVLKKRGVAVHVGTKVESLDVTKAGVKAVLSSGETIEADRVLVATGRRPATDDVGLESVGITTNRGFIPVNDKMETSAMGVYCIGDANGRALLAHAASAQGVVAAQNALGQDVSFDKPIPWAVYTFPEIAGVGVTEQRATEKALPIAVGTFPLGYLGKAMAAEHTDGFVKVIRHRETDELLGVHILGHNATEMIHAAAAVMSQKGTASDLAEMIFAHPTLSEGVKEAAEDALGVALHLPPRRVVEVTAES
ncbi:MAG: dihydrolipoyl dehydrogenase [Phycisphaerae bacterium]|nr:dihydrolipoyl dehydrogenase [Phycisphaerae bacterium]